jgi:hypothetical protein
VRCAGPWRCGACIVRAQARTPPREAAHRFTLVSESLTHGPAMSARAVETRFETPPPSYSSGSLMMLRSRFSRGVRFAKSFLCLWLSMELNV